MFIKKISKLIINLPVALLMVVLGTILFGADLPLELQRGCYTFSMIVKEVLIFLLPIIIFSLLFGSVVNLGGEKGTLKFLLLLIVCVCASSFVATWIAYLVGSITLNNISGIAAITSPSNSLEPLITFKLPKLIRNEIALALALVCGLFVAHFGKKYSHFATHISTLATKVLSKIFIPIVPFFVLGFLLKLQYDGVLLQILKNYAVIFLVIFITQLSYVLLLFLIGAKFNLTLWGWKLKNTLPPMLSGFSTMSSAATMPLTLLAAEKNTNNPTLARVVIPSTVNIHLLGDCIADPILALAIMHSFGFAAPSLSQYFMFAVFFVVAKFAVAAVPGGGIIVILPVLQQYFGFNSEMLSLITALYIMFDSVITCMNVTGNSAFVVLFNNFYKLFKPNKVHNQT